MPFFVQKRIFCIKWSSLPNVKLTRVARLARQSSIAKHAKIPPNLPNLHLHKYFWVAIVNYFNSSTNLRIFVSGFFFQSLTSGCTNADKNSPDHVQQVLSSEKFHFQKFFRLKTDFNKCIYLKKMISKSPFIWKNG